MNKRLGNVALGLLGLGLLLGGQGPARAELATAQEEIEVLARGPVHEAYAEPHTGEPRPTPVVPKQPPKPVEEIPAEQKPEGEEVQWVPGYWAWDDERKDYLWVSGFWRVPPPGRQWVPGYWHQAEQGWQWVP